jgi:hypothetical protein
MPEFQFTKGNIDPDFLDFIQDNENSTITVTAEVETPRQRLRGAFHAILTAWFLSQCYSCTWNGFIIRTQGGLKKYYKYHGCGGKFVTYSYAGEESNDIDFFLNNLPEDHHRFIVYEPRPWEKMNKKQQSLALNIMLTEIDQAGDTTKEVEECIKKLYKDKESLMSIDYYKNIKGFDNEKRY